MMKNEKQTPQRKPKATGTTGARTQHRHAERARQSGQSGRVEHASADSAGRNLINATLLAHASEVLAQLLEFRQPADSVLSSYFREQRNLGGRERGFIAETCYMVLRHKRQLEKRVHPARSPRWLLLAALLRFGGVAQKQLADVVTSTEREWLPKFKAQDEPELSLAEQTDLPDWLVERLLTQHSEAAVIEIARSLNQSAPLDVRVNLMKASRDDVLQRLHASGIEANACHYAPCGIRLKSKPALQKHPLFLEGCIEVQDEGSQLLGALLAPRRGEMVADFCAGAGGKTLLLGAMMRSTGRLYAFDVSAKRLAKLKPRLARSGLSNVHPVCLESEHDVRVKRLAGKMDRVLVDAPCSGLGTLRRNPDLKWRQTWQGVEELTRKQRDILAGAARLVKPGGRLVYATCSILEEENAAIVNDFLAAHPEFTRLKVVDVLAQQGICMEGGADDDMRLWPHRHATDGFYAAVLERQR